MFGRSRGVKKRNPWFIRILALSLVIAIIASGVGVVFGSGGTIELVDDSGPQQLSVKGDWVQFGWSKRLTITEGIITLPDGTYAITSGEGWAECDGTLKLIITVKMGPFLEPCETQPPCETCPTTCPQPCPTTCKVTIKATYCTEVVLGTWTVARNEAFTIYPEQCKNELPSSIYVEACGKKVKIDVSCSLEPDMTFDGFTVVSVEKSTSKECDDGYTCGCKCEEKCNGIKSLTLKYIGECYCDDNCNVPSNCDCGSSGCKPQCCPQTPTYCEKYKFVTIKLQGKYCGTVKIREIAGIIIQPCDKPPTYLYKYSYQSDFNLYGALDCGQYVSYSGTFSWWQAESWWSRCFPCFSGDY